MGVSSNLFSTNREDGYRKVTILGVEFKLKTRERKYGLERLFCNSIRSAKINNKKIIFINPVNFQYSCNLKYIADELLKRKIDFDLVWTSSRKTDKSYLPNKFRCVRYTSLRFLWELMTAKAWICNSHMFLPLKKGVIKNKETIYFQTFHGSMGIKKIDGDTENVYQKLGWLEWQKKDASLYDYLFTDSQMEYDLFKTAFWGYGCIKKIGKARDCVFYQDSTAYIEKVKKFYDIPQENKILLYAPTWRSDWRTSCFNIDVKLLKRVLNKRFGGTWSILIRAHNHMKKVEGILFDKTEVIDTSDYYDMQELLVAADVLVSDYSSCLPEYVILKKPSFIYAPDLDYYNSDNGFYYPLTTLPSPIAQDNGKLADNILNFDETSYKRKAEEFLVKMGHQDDENSCVRIVDFILGKVEENAQ